MSLFEKYAEDRNKGSVDVPPQGKGSKPYFAPHAKNNAKAKIRVAEKPKNALGDEASPTQKDPKANLPGGTKPDTSKLGGLKNEEFIKATSDMSDADFVSANVNTDGMIELPDNVTPYELAAHAAHLIYLDHRARRVFIQELKRLDPEGTLLSEAVAPPTSARFKKPAIDTRFEVGKKRQPQPSAATPEAAPAQQALDQVPDGLGQPAAAAQTSAAMAPPVGGGAAADSAADLAS